MFIEGYSFPHPVLGNGNDIIEGTFNVEIDIYRSKERKIVFENFNVQISDRYFVKLVEENKAKVLIKIYCSSTFSTWVIELPSKTFLIDENDLINKAEIQIFLVANQTINDYYSDTFNPQFENNKFSLNPDDVLGISGKITLPIEKIHEKLGLGNIFKFFHHESHKPINFEYHHDKIYINYPVTEKGEHPPKALFERKPWTAFNIFIISALTGALEYIKNNPIEAETWEWYLVLDSYFPKESRGSEPFIDAQKIFGDEIPMLLAYQELMK